MFKTLFQLLLKTQQKDANSRQIAKHLSDIVLYEKKGIDTLYPDVKDKCIRLKDRMSKLGMPILIEETFRTAKRQDSLSRTVTRAKGLQSYHQYGLAFDVSFRIYRYKPPAGWWDILRVEAEKLGLEGIGSWDAGHFEWHPGFTWRELESYFGRD